MYKIGFGNDVHRLEAGRPLILGGIEIPSEAGAVGHSDADALLHAITDAILGALALGDIGSHFSDNDKRWKDANSLIFLGEAVRLAKERGYEIGNLDSIVCLEKPKLRPFIEKMREKLASEIAIKIDCVSIKAKTGEGLDAVGKCQAIKAEACVLLKKI